MNLDSKLQNKEIFKLQKHVICATLVLPIKTGRKLLDIFRKKAIIKQ